MMKSIEVVAAVIFDEQGRIFATQRGYGVLSISKCNLGCNLVKFFEEAKFRCVKVQFFSGSVV